MSVDELVSPGFTTYAVLVSWVLSSCPKWDSEAGG